MGQRGGNRWLRGIVTTLPCVANDRQYVASTISASVNGALDHSAVRAGLSRDKKTMWDSPMAITGTVP